MGCPQCQSNEISPSGVCLICGYRVEAKPESGEQDARGVIGRVQEQLRTAMALGQWPVTFSFGVMTCYHGVCDVEELVRRADALMYRSKSNGKDRITYDVMGHKAGPHQ